MDDLAFVPDRETEVVFLDSFQNRYGRLCWAEARQGSQILWKTQWPDLYREWQIGHCGQGKKISLDQDHPAVEGRSHLHE
jgi:hypothetical protein